MIQNCVLREYQAERERSQQPGYLSLYDEGFVSENAKHGGPHIDRVNNEVPPEKTAKIQCKSDGFGAGIFDN